MADIFLSYAREDQAAAQDVARTLQTCGWSVFWDRNIPHGEDYRAYIQRQLDVAGCVVVLWSRRSNVSPWVIDESNEALESRRLVPALIENVKPPFGFRQLQAADLTPEGAAFRERELEGLRTAIRAKLTELPAAEASTGDDAAGTSATEGPSERDRARDLTISREAISTATVVTLLGGLAGPVAFQAGANNAMLLWAMASVCAGLVIGRPGVTVAAIARASVLPGLGHAAGAIGTIFFQWAAAQLTSGQPMAVMIPFGRSGGVIDFGSPSTLPIMLVLSLATCVGSWILISAAAAGAGPLIPALTDNDSSKLRSLERLRRWGAAIAAAIAVGVAAWSALSQ
jgi:hypothetical protein